MRFFIIIIIVVIIIIYSLGPLSRMKFGVFFILARQIGQTIGFIISYLSLIIFVSFVLYRHSHSYTCDVNSVNFNAF